MRDGANLPADLLDHGRILRNGPGCRRIELIGLALHDRHVHAEGGQQLPDAVVQLSRNLPPFFIPHLLQPAR